MNVYYTRRVALTLQVLWCAHESYLMSSTGAHYGADLGVTVTHVRTRSELSAATSTSYNRENDCDLLMVKHLQRLWQSLNEYRKSIVVQTRNRIRWDSNGTSFPVERNDKLKASGLDKIQMGIGFIEVLNTKAILLL